MRLRYSTLYAALHEALNLLPLLLLGTPISKTELKSKKSLSRIAALTLSNGEDCNAQQPPRQLHGLRYMYSTRCTAVEVPQADQVTRPPQSSFDAKCKRKGARRPAYHTSGLKALQEPTNSKATFGSPRRSSLDESMC